MEEVRLRCNGCNWQECLKAQIRAAQETRELDLYWKQMKQRGLGDPVM